MEGREEEVRSLVREIIEKEGLTKKSQVPPKLKRKGKGQRELKNL